MWKRLLRTFKAFGEGYARGIASRRPKLFPNDHFVDNRSMLEKRYIGIAALLALIPILLGSPMQVVYVFCGLAGVMILIGLLAEAASYDDHRDLLRSAALTDERPPILLLRSFTDDAIWRTDRIRGERGLSAEGVSQLGSLADAVKPWGLLVLVGDLKPKDDPHCELIFLATTQEDWRVVMAQVALASIFILVAPALTPSIREELRVLADDTHLLAKTAVYMPPSFLDWGYARKHWERMTGSLLAEGYKFPEYSAKGLIYVPQRDFSVQKGMSLERVTLRQGLAWLGLHRNTGFKNLRQLIAELGKASRVS